MIIDRIELFLVAMPLVEPWRTAYGEDRSIHSVLCRVSSGATDGWGESTPFAAPCYSPEWAGGVFAVTRQWLAPAILGKDIRSGRQLQEMLAVFKGNPFAKAVLDAAWWSLHCNATDTPLHTALGATRDQVPVGADFSVMDSIDDLLACVGSAVAEGFPRIKLKFRPGWDLTMLRAVRQAFPAHTFHIDCNSGYRMADRHLFEQIDQLGLAMIEQPLAADDLLDHSVLQARLRTPVCLDESIRHPRHARQAIALKSCWYVNVKPGRVGGLTNAVTIHNMCRRAGIPCWVGGMLESATGAAQCIALAMLDNFTYPADIFPSSRFYAEDLSQPPIVLAKTPAGAPGVAALDQLPAPNPTRLKQQTVQRAVIR